MREQGQVFEKNLPPEENFQPEEDLQSENTNESWIVKLQNLELERGPWFNPKRRWVNRQSYITAGELIALITVILIFGFTGILSPEITGGVALGVFLGESLSVCITERSLLSHLLSSPHIFSKPKKPAVKTNKQEVSSIKEKNSQAVETNKEEISPIEAKNSQAVATNKEEASSIEEKNSNENTSYTTFRTIFGIITKKISATENSKLNIQSENSSNYGSNGETIGTSQTQKTPQIPEDEKDQLLGSIKYGQSEESKETSTTIFRGLN